MIRYSILKSNNLENEFFLSTPARRPIPLEQNHFSFEIFLSTLISHFSISFSTAAFATDTKRRRSRSARSSQFMYEIIKPPIDDSIIGEEDSQMKCCHDTAISVLCFPIVDLIKMEEEINSKVRKVARRDWDHANVAHKGRRTMALYNPI